MLDVLDSLVGLPLQVGDGLLRQGFDACLKPADVPFKLVGFGLECVNRCLTPFHFGLQRFERLSVEGYQLVALCV